MTKTKSLLIVLTFAFGIMLASTISAASVVVYAQQKNQTNTTASSSSSGNQTTTNVTPAGQQATKIINQTSIPANQTTTTVQKKTEPVGNVPLPSGNQTIASRLSTKIACCKQQDNCYSCWTSNNHYN